MRCMLGKGATVRGMWARRTSDGEKGCEGEVRCMLGKGAARVSEARERGAGGRGSEGCQGSERGAVGAARVSEGGG